MNSFTLRLTGECDDSYNAGGIQAVRQESPGTFLKIY
jgi:hypothetical protein